MSDGNDNKCCCEKCQPVTVDRCGDFIITERINIGDLDCTGRLIKVPVTLRACCNKKVNVAVLICDERNKVQGMKVQQLPPNCSTDNNRCETRQSEFCFPIPDTICTGATFNIKVIASYAPEENCPCI